MGSPMALLYLTLPDLEGQKQAYSICEGLLSGEGPELGYMLPLKRTGNLI